MGVVFGFDPPDGDNRVLRLLPLDRTRCGFDGGKMISTSGAYSLEMTVPGAQVACGGTTAVVVAPTHRRQGVLREMMRAHLDDVKEHGEPIAALWASDSAIYGRFGYGCASICYDIAIEPDHATLSRLAPQPGRARMVDRAEALEVVPPLYDRLRMEIPGFFSRTPHWWEDRSFRDSESTGATTNLRYGVVDGEDGVAGFTSFRTKAHWDEGHGSGKVIVQDLFAVTPEAWAGTWALVANQDLVARVESGLRPSWDPIFDLLAGTRRALTFRYDALWVRLMDVPAALTARSYSAPVDVVLESRRPHRRSHRLVSAQRRPCRRRVRADHPRAFGGARPRGPQRRLHGTAPIPTMGTSRPPRRSPRRPRCVGRRLCLGPRALVPRALLSAARGPVCRRTLGLRTTQNVGRKT